MEQLEECARAEPPRRDRPLPWEGDGEVDRDGSGGDEDHDDRASDEARGDRGPDLLNADVLLMRGAVDRDPEVAAQRVLDLHQLRAVRGQRGDGEVAGLIARRPLRLHLRAQTREVPVHDGGNLRLGRRLGKADVDDVAALEVDAQVEAPEEDREDAGDDDRERSGEVPVAILDDVEAPPWRMLGELLVDLGVEARGASNTPAEH